METSSTSSCECPADCGACVSAHFHRCLQLAALLRCSHNQSQATRTTVRGLLGYVGKQSCSAGPADATVTVYIVRRLGEFSDVFCQHSCCPSSGNQLHHKGHNCTIPWQRTNFQATAHPAPLPVQPPLDRSHTHPLPAIPHSSLHPSIFPPRSVPGANPELILYDSEDQVVSGICLGPANQIYMWMSWPSWQVDKESLPVFFELQCMCRGIEQ